MCPRYRTLRFSDGNREALIIRYRAILHLGLLDYFNNENKYSKIIVREILDMFEGIIKALAESLSIQVERRRFTAIFTDILGCAQIPEVKKRRIQEINTSLSAAELNSIRALIRNPEAHSLNLPSIPHESCIRCWRLIYEAITICDQDLYAYAKARPEFEDFVNLHSFYYKYVINGEKLDFRTIKIDISRISGNDDKGKTREIVVERERSVSELIKHISQTEV